MRTRVIGLLFMLLAPTIRTAGDTPAPGAEVVSLVRLITAPEQYDGKAVLIVGFLRLEFEGNGLYLHEEDYEHGITKNAIWVVRNTKINERADALNMHYVMLGGTFDASHNGTWVSSAGPLGTSGPQHRGRHAFRSAITRQSESASD